MNETTTQETLNFPCDKCDRRFKSPAARNMHKVRTHGKGWDTSKNFRKNLHNRVAQREKLLAAKREYNRKLRARYKLEGKDSRGYPLPDRGLLKRISNLNRKGGKPWTDAQRDKFRRTMKAKSKRIQIVYPDPRGVTEFNKGEIVRGVEVTIPALKHCPNCGEHLEGWRYQS
jgi:hypothetical protein